MAFLSLMSARLVRHLGRTWNGFQSLDLVPRASRALSTYENTHGNESVPTFDGVHETVAKLLMTPQDLLQSKYSPTFQKLTKEPSQPQASLPARPPGHGRVRAVVPLGSDAKTRQRYLTINNTIRFGQLLDDIDFLSGVTSLIHNRDPNLSDGVKSPILVLTALLDRLDIDLTFPPLSPFKDVFYDGRITWVGESSLESTVYAEQELDGKMQRFLEAKVVYVNRNPVTFKPAICFPLELVTEEDKAMFIKGEAHKAKRIREARESVLKTAPSREESLRIHDQFLSTVDFKSETLDMHVKPEDSVWMEDTIVRSFVICQPTQGNVYSKVSGGFLLRKAFESAWTTAAVYSKCKHPRCKAIDDVFFLRPVEIGSLLFLSSQVVYNEGPCLQIRVRTRQVDWAQVESSHGNEMINDCHFSFDCSDQSDTKKHYIIPKVIPKSYAESMLHVDGKRRWDESFGNTATD